MTMRLVFGTVLLAALGIALAPPAGAEIVRLPGGAFLQGELLDSDQAGFTFKRWDTGGVVRLAWEQILPEDRNRLRRALGLEFVAEERRVTVPGYRFHLRSGDILEGVVESETADAVRIRRATGEFTYPKDVIKRREPVELDVLSIYTQEEAYLRKVAQPPQTSDEHYDVASYCRQIGHYEKEREHLEAVQQLSPEYKPTFIRNRLEALVGLVEEAMIRGRIKEILREVARKNFNEAYAGWEALREEYPDHPIVSDDSEAVVEQIEQGKLQYTAQVVVRDWFENMRRILRKRSLDKEVKLADAKKYLQKDLSMEIVANIVEKRGLDEADIRAAFEERKIYSVYKGNYGTGTFLVEKSARSGSGGSSGAIDDLGKRLGLDEAARNKVKELFGQGGSSGSSGKKKAMTPDEWWELATADMKYQWMLGFYAENSGDMEVVRVESRACPDCQGRGYQTFIAAGADAAGQQGGQQNTMCPRCQGLGKDRVVVFK